MNRPHQITRFFTISRTSVRAAEEITSRPVIIIIHVLSAGLDIRQMCSLNNPPIIIIVMYAWLIKFFCSLRTPRHPALEFDSGMLCLFICCEITCIIIVIYSFNSKKFRKGIFWRIQSWWRSSTKKTRKWEERDEETGEVKCRETQRYESFNLKS